MKRKLFIIGAFGLMMSLMSFIQKEDITIFLVGDSTVADKPYKGGNPEKGWGQVFPLYFTKGVRVENHAVNGRSTKSFIDEGRWDKVMSRIKPGDYVIVEFGHNDSKSKDPKRYAAADTDYRINLQKYVTDARSKGAIPVLATPIVRRRFNEKSEFYDTHGRYPEVVREVAQEMNVPLLDLHQRTKELVITFGEERSKALFLHITPGEYNSLPQGEQDDTHLSAYGAFKVSDLVVEEIEKTLPELTQYLKK